MKLNQTVLRIACKAVEAQIEEFIRKTVPNEKANSVVVGLSGGIDSSVVAVLCARALGNNRVIGILMPTSFTPREDIEDAEALASNLKLKTYYVPVDPIVESFLKSIPVGAIGRIPVGNIRARTRMTINYYFANMFNCLVAGTGDRSENLIGFFTKYGDGGVDFLPIVHLYKTQVRQLASHLRLPRRLVEKPASPQLWSGHKATDELPADYPTIDLILYGLFDAKLPKEEIAKQLNISEDLIEAIVKRHIASEHKRTQPSMLMNLP